MNSQPTPDLFGGDTPIPQITVTDLTFSVRNADGSSHAKLETALINAYQIFGDRLISIIHSL